MATHPVSLDNRSVPRRHCHASPGDRGRVDRPRPMSKVLGQLHHGFTGTQSSPDRSGGMIGVAHRIVMRISEALRSAAASSGLETSMGELNPVAGVQSKYTAPEGEDPVGCVRIRHPSLLPTNRLTNSICHSSSVATSLGDICANTVCTSSHEGAWAVGEAVVVGATVEVVVGGLVTVVVDAVASFDELLSDPRATEPPMIATTRVSPTTEGPILRPGRGRLRHAEPHRQPSDRCMANLPFAPSPRTHEQRTTPSRRCIESNDSLSAGSRRLGEHRAHHPGDELGEFVEKGRVLRPREHLPDDG